MSFARSANGLDDADDADVDDDDDGADDDTILPEEIKERSDSGPCAMESPDFEKRIEDE
jgi:hypothetical protein